jgi:hypothetical protein
MQMVMEQSKNTANDVPPNFGGNQNIAGVTDED